MNSPHPFWENLDLTVMPDGDEGLNPNPSTKDVIDYLEAFCRQYDFGVGSPETILNLMEKPETLPAMHQAGEQFLRDSPSYRTLRAMLGLPEVDPGPSNPWDPEPHWMKQDRLEGRPLDTSLG